MSAATGADLTILVPMLGRPHRVAPLLASIHQATPGAEVLFVLTPTDTAVLAAVRAAGTRHITVPYQRGDYARKINAGYRESDRPLLFLGADDLHFHPGWHQAATAELRDWAVGVVGTNDLGSERVMKGEHATHSLVTRTYADEHGTIDQPGAILHEGYWHEWVDDELVGTAMHRGAWAFAADAHVEHLHPSYGKAPRDSQYLAQRRRMRHSRPLYETRRALWT
ncbi:hypothetical protein BBK14_11255 [Parafrankia soli]|uniref:Glycosyltransferase 2-like domain-containing protein n=1 Tax=Parafrankia soli TaxID=2599596 RepID=A0A1S1R8W9_9ACTN|nr:glycosyltransferase family A protein [Parafrankia soli]OHV42191.1 hypothetical protein BBK14_11255 [Parafrankia soli]